MDQPEQKAGTPIDQQDQALRTQPKASRRYTLYMDVVVLLLRTVPMERKTLIRVYRKMVLMVLTFPQHIPAE